MKCTMSYFKCYYVCSYVNIIEEVLCTLFLMLNVIMLKMMKCKMYYVLCWLLLCIQLC